MSANAKPDQFRLGFLTAVEVPDQGYVGGLLVTNRHGRPLEFQCTAPVKPNRTQEILYGPTLTPFVLGELIGRALIEKAGIKPHLILTERDEILELRNHVSIPVACLDDAQAPAQEGSSAAPDSATDAPKRTGEKLKLGKQWVRLHAAHDADRPTIEQDAQVPHTADLREPFERVREALRETLKSGALR